MMYDRVKYELVIDNIRHEIEEPKNWNETTKVWARNTEYHGIDVNVTDALIFHGVGYDLLKEEYESKKLNANVILIRYLKNGNTDAWEIEYSGTIDFSTYRENKYTITCNLNVDYTTKVFKANKSTKIEIEKETDLNENSVDAISTTKVEIDGIPLTEVGYLKSLVENFDNDLIEITTSNPKVRIPIPFRFDGDSEGMDVDLAETTISAFATYNSASYNNGLNRAFYTESIYGNNNVSIDLNFDMILPLTLISQSLGSGTTVDVRLVLSKYEATGGIVDGEPVDSILIEQNDLAWNLQTLSELTGNGTYPEFEVAFKGNGKYNISLDEGQSLGLELFIELTNISGVGVLYFNPKGVVTESSDEVVAYIKTKSVSTFVKSINPALKLKEAFNSISKRVFFNETNGEILDDEQWKNLMVIHGYWLRNIPKGTDIYRPITTSFDDMFKSLNALTPIGMEIDEYKGITIEQLSHFYQDFIFAQLGKIYNYEKFIELNDYYTDIEVGYSDADLTSIGAKLTEFNSKIGYKTNLLLDNKKLSLLSSYRADGNGIERARRSSENQEETTSIDDNIFFLDCIEDYDGTYRVKRPSDFNAISESAYGNLDINTRICPAYNFNRHSKYLKYLIFGQDRFKQLYSEGGNIELKIDSEGLMLAPLRLFNSEFRGDYIDGVNATIDFTFDITNISNNTPFYYEFKDVISGLIIKNGSLDIGSTSVQITTKENQRIGLFLKSSLTNTDTLIQLNLTTNVSLADGSNLLRVPLSRYNREFKEDALVMTDYKTSVVFDISSITDNETVDYEWHDEEGNVIFDGSQVLDVGTYTWDFNFPKGKRFYLYVVSPDTTKDFVIDGEITVNRYLNKLTSDGKYIVPISKFWEELKDDKLYGATIHAKMWCLLNSFDGVADVNYYFDSYSTTDIWDSGLVVQQQGNFNNLDEGIGYGNYTQLLVSWDNQYGDFLRLKLIGEFTQYGITYKSAPIDFAIGIRKESNLVSVRINKDYNVTTYGEITIPELVIENSVLISNKNDVTLDEIEDGIFSGDRLSFEYPSKIEGINEFTNGVPNYYGLLEFEIDDKKYRGYLMKVEYSKGISKVEVKIK